MIVTTGLLMGTVHIVLVAGKQLARGKKERRNARR